VLNNTESTHLNCAALRRGGRLLIGDAKPWPGLYNQEGAAPPQRGRAGSPPPSTHTHCTQPRAALVAPTTQTQAPATTTAAARAGVMREQAGAHVPAATWFVGGGAGSAGMGGASHGGVGGASHGGYAGALLPTSANTRKDWGFRGARNNPPPRPPRRPHTQTRPQPCAAAALPPSHSSCCWLGRSFITHSCLHRRTVCLAHCGLAAVKQAHSAPVQGRVSNELPAEPAAERLWRLTTQGAERSHAWQYSSTQGGGALKLTFNASLTCEGRA
jgi:hypothetical protein